MDKKTIKKALAHLSIAGLVAGFGVVPGAVAGQGGSGCGKSSCGKKGGKQAVVQDAGPAAGTAVQNQSGAAGKSSCKSSCKSGCKGKRSGVTGKSSCKSSCKSGCKGKASGKVSPSATQMKNQVRTRSRTMQDSAVQQGEAARDQMDNARQQ